MDVSHLATKKQKHLMEKYKEKYGADYLLNYLHQTHPTASWDELRKDEAQKIITGRKLHERKWKDEQIALGLPTKWDKKKARKASSSKK